MKAAVVNDFSGKEFPMSDRNFSQIKSTAYNLTGINLTDQKKNMIYGRLSRRLRALGLRTFDEYCEIIKDVDSPEIHEFINSITTNLTSFFREPHHFDYLKNDLIPSLIRSNASSKKIRVWSAGCSTGEEPYSISSVFSSFASLRDWDVKILATDLDSNVVNTGLQGVYSAERAENIPNGYSKYFEYDANGDVCMSDDVRKLISFKQLNLLKDWPMKGKFDIIFCRNVVIYFDAETQKKLFNRYADLLKPEGHLFIGHSENLNNVCTRFKPIGRTVYVKSN